VRCPKCATILADDSWVCSGCGFPVRPRHHIVHLDFWGSPLQVLLWALLMALMGIGISLPPAIHIRILSIDVSPPWGWSAPSPWLTLAWILSVILAIAAVWVFEGACRWFCRSLRSATLLEPVSPAGADRFWAGGFYVHWLAADGTSTPGGCPAGNRAVRPWPVGRSQHPALVCGSRGVKLQRGFSFLGTYAELVGWEILLGLSVLTVIGWAWVLAAMYRWLRATRAPTISPCDFTA